MSDGNPERMDENRNTGVESGQYREGNRVVVKPPNVRCDTRWSGGTVTRVNSPWNVDVNGVPRHIQDVRLARSGTGEREAAPRVPQPVIVVENEIDDAGKQDGRQDGGNEKPL